MIFLLFLLFSFFIAYANNGIKYVDRWCLCYACLWGRKIRNFFVFQLSESRKFCEMKRENSSYRKRRIFLSFNFFLPSTQLYIFQQFYFFSFLLFMKCNSNKIINCNERKIVSSSKYLPDLKKKSHKCIFTLCNLFIKTWFIIFQIETLY